MFANLTVNTESINFTVSNVVYCQRLCSEVGEVVLFSFHAGSELYSWPVTSLRAKNAAPIFMSCEYILHV